MANQVKGIHSSIPVLEDEAIHYDFLLVEPQDDHVSVDAFLCMHSNNSEKCVQSDDVPCKFDTNYYGPRQEQHQMKARDVPDIRPNQTEAGNFYSQNGLSSFCEDYLLDGEVNEYSIGMDHKSGTGLQKSLLVNHTQVDGPDGNGASQKSGSSGTTDPADYILGGPGVNNSVPDRIFSCTGDIDKSLENCWFKYPSFTDEDIEEDVSSMLSNGNGQLMGLKSSFTSGQVPSPYTSNQESKDSSPPCQKVVMESSSLQNDISPTKSPVQACSIDNLYEKRQRKPPKRFIDELSGTKSITSLKKKESSAPISKGKDSSGGASKHQIKKPKAESFSPEDPTGFAIQVPFGPLVPNESPVAKKKVESRYPLPSSPNKKVFKSTKEVSVAETDSETEYDTDTDTDTDDPETEIETETETESEEDNAKVAKHEESGAVRRKHHILWTVSEVKLLIDGVSQFGVGRWSRIKRDFFQSSVHRTPVDLKDKWRNLLKATRVLKGSKSGRGGKRNLAWRPLPKTILRRVNELSTIHPYPRDSRARG